MEILSNNLFIQPIALTNCIQQAANVLLVAKDEIKKSNYGLLKAKTEIEARETLEGINDVLTWFCLNHPNARFCRTLVLSGFTLRHFESEISSESIINDANSRLTAMLKLGEYGMLGEYQQWLKTLTKNHFFFYFLKNSLKITLRMDRDSMHACESQILTMNLRCLSEKTNFAT